MQTSIEEVRLENLNQELKSMEKMLQKADEYNDTLSKHINKLRAIVSSNQKVFQKYKINEECMKEILNDDNHKEILYDQLIQKIGSIENKLFVTVNLFNEYKRRVQDKSCARDDIVESKLCNQLNALGTNLISVGNQITELREEKMAKDCETANNLHHGSCSVPSQANNLCWTQCNTQVENNVLEFTVMRSNKETPIRQIRCQKKIIERVETILNKAQHSNIRTETLTNVKLLAKMVLGVLVKRNHKQCFLIDMDNNTLGSTIAENQNCNPYL